MITEFHITLKAVKRTYGEGARFNEEAFKERLQNAIESLYIEVTSLEVKTVAR